MSTYIICLIIIGVLVILGAVISCIIFIKKKTLTGFKTACIFCTSIFILLIGFNIVNSIFINNLKCEVSTEINTDYSLTVDLNKRTSTRDSDFTFINYYEGRLLGPFTGSYMNDTRLYDIYIKYNDGLNLYIKNEKGAYIPITDMSVDYMRRH